jgi:hypothetical protein
MDQTGKAFTSEPADARQWIGRIIMAVILGEAIWSLIVSVMNNLVVPWLGDVMGQSSGLPTSFTQRPYDYPALFVSVVELCVAVIVALVFNYVFQRPRLARVKAAKSSVLTSPAEPARVAAWAATAAPLRQTATTQATPPVISPAPVAKPDPATPPSPVIAAPAPPAPSLIAPAPAAKPAAPPSPAPQVVNSGAKPQPPTPKKPKEVYYNIVGEPVASDED